MNRKKYSIASNQKLNSYLSYLASKTGKSRIQLIKDCIEPIVQLSAGYETFQYYIEPKNSSEILIYFLGKSRMIVGSSNYKDELCDLILREDIRHNFLSEPSMPFGSLVRKEMTNNNE